MPKSGAVRNLAKKRAEEKVRRAALKLLEQDKEFDDAVFTPPGAISLCIDAKEADANSTRGDEPW
jgi:hypothetical protein